jgi:integrase
MTGQSPFSSVMGPTIARYLSLKEALGRRYAVERDVLKLLDSFLAPTASDLSPETFDRWCLMQDHLTSGVRRNRMRIVRNLCLYRRRTEAACFVPNAALFPHQHQYIRPHIFTEGEIAALLRVADALVPTASSPLRRQAFRLAIVLLYTTGLRRGELLRLTLGDYEPHESTLLVRASKFHKSRLVPISADASREMGVYIETRRAHRMPLSAETPLLWNLYQGGKPYTGGGFGQSIRALLRTSRIRTAAGRLPRVHDFRHTIAVHALLRWYRAGVDVQAKLPFLASYMGHVSIVSTQYYLQFVEPLATAASERFAGCFGALVSARHVPGRQS